MDNLKHTPGPWQAVLNNADDIFIHSENVSFIAQVSGPHQRRQINPNARLIAAAPEMLDYLIFHKDGGFDGKRLIKLIEKATGISIEAKK